MGMSREERREWREEIVSIEIDNLLKETPRALIVEVGGDAFAVGKGVVENADELIEQLELLPEERDDDLTLEVPRWLAIDNGWEDDDL
jgi:hypothetical protein